jgi:hypothetical protein
MAPTGNFGFLAAYRGFLDGLEKVARPHPGPLPRGEGELVSVSCIIQRLHGRSEHSCCLRAATVSPLSPGERAGVRASYSQNQFRSTHDKRRTNDCFESPGSGNVESSYETPRIPQNLLVASAAAAATTTSLAQAAGTQSEPAREFYELRQYHLRQGPMLGRFDKFYREIALPAWNRAGVSTVGVFDVMIGRISQRNTCCSRSNPGMP